MCAIEFSLTILVRYKHPGSSEEPASPNRCGGTCMYCDHKLPINAAAIDLLVIVFTGENRQFMK